jgi:hypothetical protein
VEFFSDFSFQNFYMASHWERIAFDWGYGAPLPGLDGNTFSLIAAGFLRVDRPGLYLFRCRHRLSSCRLFLDRQLTAATTVLNLTLAQSLRLKLEKQHSGRYHTPL